MADWRKIKRDESACKLQIGSKSSEELERIHDFLTKLLTLKDVDKTYTTYVKGTYDCIQYNERYKVYPSYNFDGTVTGRISCSGYTVNKHKKGVSFHTLSGRGNYNVRKIFRGPEDWVFITADFSGMELRILSHLAKDKIMQTAFKNGEDLHTYSAAMAFNKDPEKITPLERQIAKAVSFLVVYGGTSFTLSKNHNISIGRANSIISNWYSAYPRIKPYMDYVQNFVEENGYCYTIFGRRRNLENIYSDNDGVRKAAIRQAINTTVQSPASDIGLCAALGIELDVERENLKAQLMGMVHDSIEIACPLSELEKVIYIVQQNMIDNPIMTNTFGVTLDVPLDIEMHVGNTFGDGVQAKFDQRKLMNMDEIQEYFNVA